MMTYHQQDPVTFIWWQFHKRHISHQGLKLTWKLLCQNVIKISQGQWNITTRHRFCDIVFFNCASSLFGWSYLPNRLAVRLINFPECNLCLFVKLKNAALFRLLKILRERRVQERLFDLISYENVLAYVISKTLVKLLGSILHIYRSYQSWTWNNERLGTRITSQKYSDLPWDIRENLHLHYTWMDPIYIDHAQWLNHGVIPKPVKQT